MVDRITPGSECGKGCIGSCQNNVTTYPVNSFEDHRHNHAVLNVDNAINPTCTSEIFRAVNVPVGGYVSRQIITWGYCYRTIIFANTLASAFLKYFVTGIKRSYPGWRFFTRYSIDNVRCLLKAGKANDDGTVHSFVPGIGKRVSEELFGVKCDVIVFRKRPKSLSLSVTFCRIATVENKEWAGQKKNVKYLDCSQGYRFWCWQLM